MNLPNSLTVTRIFLVPLLVVVLLTKFEGRLILGVPKEFVGAAIFALASLTDWLDGYLARRRKQITPLGQVIDPLADKLLTSAALISLVQMDLAPAWMVAVIIGREFAVTTLRSLAYARGVAMPASPLGKIKMVAQVVAILALILAHGQMRGVLHHRAGGAVGGRRDGAGVGRRLLPPLQRDPQPARRRVHARRADAPRSLGPQSRGSDIVSADLRSRSYFSRRDEVAAVHGVARARDPHQRHRRARSRSRSPRRGRPAACRRRRGRDTRPGGRPAPCPARCRDRSARSRRRPCRCGSRCRRRPGPST